MGINNRGSAFPAQQQEHGFWGKVGPYLAQWGGTAALWPAGLAAHEVWGTDPAALPWAAAGMTLGSAALTAATARLSTGRPSIRAHSTATVGAASAWCTAAMIAGPTSHPLLDIWLMGGAAVALSWNIRRLMRGGDQNGGKSAENEFFKAVKLAGTKVRGELEVSPNKVVAQLQLPPGQLTADDVTGARGRLASALSVGTTAVRVNADPEHHDRATLTVVPNDVLKGKNMWPGPSAMGGSIAEPLVLGLYEDGEVVCLWLPGSKADGRNATHVLVMGMNGAGKSHGAKIAWAEILTRADTVLWLADPAKGKQTVSPVLEGVDWAALTLEESQDMVDALPDVIRERANALGEMGHDQWVPGCGMPFLVVWIEEAAPVVRDSETMIDIAQQARSAGVSIVLSMQRPSYRNITTDVRQQLGSVWCFGVKSIADAAFALSDELIESGANPAAWSNRKPGYSYLEAPGIEDDRMVSPLRSFAVEDADITAAVRAFTPHRAQTDPVTARAGGNAYANRTTGVAAMTTKSTPAAKDTTPKPAKTAPNPFTGQLTEHDDTTPPELPVNPEPELGDVDVDAELPAVTEHDDELFQFATKPTLAEARAALVTVLNNLQATGATEVGPKDIPKEFIEHVRSRPWVSAELGRLATLGGLVETDRAGVYRFPRRANAA